MYTDQQSGPSEVCCKVALRSECWPEGFMQERCVPASVEPMIAGSMLAGPYLSQTRGTFAHVFLLVHL